MFVCRMVDENAKNAQAAFGNFAVEAVQPWLYPTAGLPTARRGARGASSSRADRGGLECAKRLVPRAPAPARAGGRGRLRALRRGQPADSFLVSPWERRLPEPAQKHWPSLEED
jgi:hypothetical protein